MEPFRASFLLLFNQVALGGLVAIAATPFHALERGFYKSTAGVLFALGALGFLGRIDIYLRSLSQGVKWATALEISFQVLFVFFFALYLYSLWGERVLFRARAFTFSLFAGLGALVVSAHGFYQASLWSLETLLYPASFFLSALLLGSVTVGMLIGHWYLIDTGQGIEPFIRVHRFFFVCLIAQIIFFLALFPLCYLLGNPETIVALRRLWEEHRFLLWARLLIGQVGPLILSAMIRHTLKIPHTMAATGLFYIALLGVFVGEILGRQILAVTSLPF